MTAELEGRMDGCGVAGRGTAELTPPGAERWLCIGLVGRLGLHSIRQ